ncbi:MAG: GNAT family N-acetyltransferase [Spirochaetes bacterium]|nr:GNAT family N-acetyltransferase [Spirochaetota bacterium]
MILLEPEKYRTAANVVKELKINNLFARSVLEKHINGFVYADNADDPMSFLIVHPYGMSLLVGKTENKDFNSEFYKFCLNIDKKRDKISWLQVYPETLNRHLSDLLGDSLVRFNNDSETDIKNIVEEYTRVNFKFNTAKYINFRLNYIYDNYNIVRTDREIFDSLQGNVIPGYFWNNADDFINYGAGFTLLIEGNPASTAYSAFIHDNQLEIGIETAENYRRNGYALYSCSALIDYCLKNNYEPVWACRLDNTGSYNLAQKLGFEQTVTIPYYRLPV